MSCVLGFLFLCLACLGDCGSRGGRRRSGEDGGGAVAPWRLRHSSYSFLPADYSGRLQRSPQLPGGYIKPDECNERDDFAASNKGRTCQRKCDTDSDCLNERKLCLCDGVCGLSCIRPEKECAELPDPPHGQVHLTGR